MSNDNLRKELNAFSEDSSLDTPVDIDILRWISIANYDKSTLTFKSEWEFLISKRAWSYISVDNNWKVLLVIGREITKSASDTNWASVNVTFYDSNFNKIDWVIPFLYYHWISVEQIEEAIKISLRNPFIVWEGVSEFTSKKVDGILVEDQAEKK